MINGIKIKLNKIKLSKLFYSNKFVMVFSFLMSFVIWIVVSSNSSEDIPITISDIPVSITLSESAVQDGLRIFSKQDITAKVDIKGNRIIVGRVTKNDIQITAPQAASTILSPGNYTLGLSAQKVGVLQDYEIVSNIDPSVVTVVVDRYRESEFDIESNIKFTPKSDYFVGNTILSAQKVKLSGPESEISKIKKVAVVSEIPGEIGSTITQKLPIVMYDAYGEVISCETIKSNINEVEASIPILMKKKVSLIPEFENVPEGFNLSKENRDMVKVVPSMLEIAGPENVVSQLENIKLGKIDFNKINIQNNKQVFPINLPTGCKSLNNQYNAEVIFNLSQFKEKTINISQFSFKNVPKGKKVGVYNGNLNITVVAPSNKINLIKSGDIVAQIIFEEGKDFSNSAEMSVSFKVNNHVQTWVYGSYFVNVSIENQ